MVHCPTCGITFTPTPANPTYCSPACWPEVQAERLATHQAVRPTLAKPKRQFGSVKRNALVRRVVGYRRFFDAVAQLKPPLSAGAIAAWCWLWSCERKGRARLSVRRLAKRFSASKSSAQRWLAELERAGLIRIIRSGRYGHSATVAAVRYSPKKR
jgi:DNA-binding transcriptional ArsR family regulator